MLDNNQLLLDLFQAYYDARQHKRNKKTALSFEINYESKLFALRPRLGGRPNQPLNKKVGMDTSCCYVTERF